jgi:hypothetical protein
MSKNPAKKANTKAKPEKTAEIVDRLVKKEVDALRVRSRVNAGRACEGGWCSAPP